MCVVSMCMTSLSFGASAGVACSDLHIGFRKISSERRCRCPLRVPFDPKVVALGVAYFQMDLSSVVQEAQTVAAGGDIVELRLLWVVSRIALSLRRSQARVTLGLSPVYGLFPREERASE